MKAFSSECTNMKVTDAFSTHEREIVHAHTRTHTHTHTEMGQVIRILLLIHWIQKHKHQERKLAGLTLQLTYIKKHIGRFHHIQDKR